MAPHPSRLFGQHRIRTDSRRYGTCILRLLLRMPCCTWPPSWSPRGAPPLAALRPTPDPDRFPPVGLTAHALLYLATLVVPTCAPPLAALRPTLDPERYPPVGLIARAPLFLWPPSLSPRGAPPLTALQPTPDPDRFPPVGLIAHAPLYLATLMVPTWRPTPRGSSAKTESGQILAGRSYWACSVVPGHPHGPHVRPHPLWLLGQHRIRTESRR